MKFQTITIQEKKLFQQYLANRYYDNINFNFSSLFLWRDWDPYGWLECENALCIKSDFYGWDAVLPPISPDDQSILKATEALIAWYKEKKQPFLMTEVTQVHLDIYEKYWPGVFSVTPYPDGANYIYNTQDLAFLKGRKYNSKRNHINRFYAQYPNFSFQPLTTKLIPGCQELMTKWYDTKALNNDIIMEKKGIDDAFANFGDLDYLGACLLVQDRVIAFTLGEPLNQDTVAIHVEKADSDYHGAFSLINQLFVKEYWLDYPFINRAEDMGQEGLRMAKESYHPCKMIMKYHLRLKEENKL